ncbi:recombinase RecF, partial [Burkholderia pseudomallei]
MSTPIGQEAEKTAKGAVDEAIKILTSSKRVEVKVEIDATGINGSSAIYNMIIGHIEQRLTPEKTIFSYFPADRSLPVGEVVIQIGPQDFKAQLDSHFSAAATKYGRLKQTVVNRAVLSRINDIDLAPEFNSIFDTFLPGKEFVGLQQKPTGLVTVLVRDKISDKVFDIDSLSSGEKGLVLSFLLFKTS